MLSSWLTEAIEGHGLQAFQGSQVRPDLRSVAAPVCDRRAPQVLHDLKPEPPASRLDLFVKPKVDDVAFVAVLFATSAAGPRLVVTMP